MDLATRYLGLTLKNPIVASASPLTIDLDNIRRIEDAGVRQLCFHAVRRADRASGRKVDQYTRAGPGAAAEAFSYLPSTSSYRTGPDEYLEIIWTAHAAASIPVIASLNGVTGAGWTDHARLAQEAGASAIELNVFFIPADPSLTARGVESRYIPVLEAVKSVVSIPVSIKLSPYFSAPAHTIRTLERVGAAGFVLFNRFYQPDIDLRDLHFRQNLRLSSPAEIRLPPLWIGILFGQLEGSLAASTSVDSSAEVVKYLLAAATVVMTTSALLRHSSGHVKVLLAGLTDWLTAQDITMLSDIRGRMANGCSRTRWRTNVRTTSRSCKTGLARRDWVGILRCRIG